MNYEEAPGALRDGPVADDDFDDGQQDFQQMAGNE